MPKPRHEAFQRRVLRMGDFLSLGAYLRAKREYYGLTQQTVAADMGYKPAQYSEIETDAANPASTTLRVIADYFMETYADVIRMSKRTHYGRTPATYRRRMGTHPGECRDIWERCLIQNGGTIHRNKERAPVDQTDAPERRKQRTTPQP